MTGSSIVNCSGDPAYSCSDPVFVSTIKYDLNGNPIWVIGLYGGAANDRARSIAVDQLGNVYVAGFVYYPDTVTSAFFTAKYDTDGNQLWLKSYNGPLSRQNEATDLALDTNGNVYVAGSSLGEDGNYDYVAIKYDPEGNSMWEYKSNDQYLFYGPGVGGFTVDAAGNAYITGCIKSEDTAPGITDPDLIDPDIITIKLTADTNDNGGGGGGGSGSGDGSGGGGGSCFISSVLP